MRHHDFETGRVYEFHLEISEKALDMMIDHGLSLDEMIEIEEQFLAGAGEITQDYVSGGSFRLIGKKICFFPKRIKGKSAEDVYRAYCKLDGDCYYCKQPRWIHRVVESKVEDGWTVRCPVEGKGDRYGMEERGV